MNPEQSAEEAFTQDVLAILTVFSAKMHGARSQMNKRALAAASAQL